MYFYHTLIHTIEDSNFPIFPTIFHPQSFTCYFLFRAAPSFYTSQDLFHFVLANPHLFIVLSTATTEQLPCFSGHQRRKISQKPIVVWGVEPLPRSHAILR